MGVVRGVARVYHRLRLSVFRKTRETRHALPSSCPVLLQPAGAVRDAPYAAVRCSTECAAKGHLQDPLVKLPDRDEGAAARSEASGTVLEAIADTGAPSVLHRLELPLHLHTANNEWLLLHTLLYDNGRSSEWASRRRCGLCIRLRHSVTAACWKCE